MLNSIKGKVIFKGEGIIYLESGNFSFEVFVSEFFLNKIKLNEEIFVLTHLSPNFEQNDLRLFGFINEKEREVFKSLISVSGIGPKACIKIISSINYEKLIEIIDKEEIDKLSEIKGIGKKTAGKILLSLKDKFVSSSLGKEIKDDFKDILESIVLMGFERRLVQTKLKEVLKENSHLNEEEIFKEVLKALTKA